MDHDHLTGPARTLTALSCDGALDFLKEGPEAPKGGLLPRAVPADETGNRSSEVGSGTWTGRMNQLDVGRSPDCDVGLSALQVRWM